MIEINEIYEMEDFKKVKILYGDLDNETLLKVVLSVGLASMKSPLFANLIEKAIKDVLKD